MTPASYSDMTILWKMSLSAPENFTMVIILDFIQLNTLMGTHCGVKHVFDGFRGEKNSFKDIYSLSGQGEIICTINWKLSTHTH